MQIMTKKARASALTNVIAIKKTKYIYSKAEKEPGVSDRDISGLIQGPQPLESNA